jgi:hypothetical protein
MSVSRAIPAGQAAAWARCKKMLLCSQTVCPDTNLLSRAIGQESCYSSIIDKNRSIYYIAGELSLILFILTAEFNIFFSECHSSA